MAKANKALSTSLLAVLYSLFFGGCAPQIPNGWDSEKGLQGMISVSGAFALYPLVVLWSEEFKKTHPHVRFNISAGGAGKGVADALSGMVDIGLVSREIHPQEYDRGAYVINVAKDAVVATINADNPNAEALARRGLTHAEFQDIFVTGAIDDWRQIDPAFTEAPLNRYTRSDAAGAAETWAAFFGRSQEDLKGVGIFGDPGMTQTIINDPNAIGYSNINFVYDLQTRSLVPGLRVVPLDINGNGQVDADEDFYTHIDSLTQAVGAGRYPAPPARNLSFLFHGKPDDVALVEFVKFVLRKESQAILPQNGYIPLNETWITEELAKLD